MIHFFRRTLLWAVVLYICAFAVVWFARSLFIYPFDPTHVTPAQAGEPRLSEYKLATDDGETLILWARPAKGNKATVLYFHGNAGNLASRAQRFDRLIDRGYGVVALGYRRSSGSTGQPSETTISQDALLVRKELSNILNHTPKGKIIYYGESLGTGVASKLATSVAPDALILEAPYTSVVSLAKEQMPIFPIDLVLDQRWQTDQHIPKVKSPTLILHGTQDKVIPYAHGKTVLKLSGAKNKKMETIKGGNHLSAFSVQGQKAIYRFIEAL
ncbi:alpha/beta hydrolase [Amylibacter sp. SFDW26]|uniref:alpha/beta hydrolase n=1 Tax=Amylibacter sp. SFDW26 TaxID=2652722 RepID=UPI0012626FE8|nr:alpha/beta hydrolase [Amylibacter sp. SFDW26]KAB7615412.1 alpha/beta hydrolase [Amylibacter sp. SFDW26]